MNFRASLTPGYQKIKPDKDASLHPCLRISLMPDVQITIGNSDSQGPAQRLSSLTNIKENNGFSFACIWGFF